MTGTQSKSARERHDDVKAACDAALRKREHEAFQEESKPGVWTASVAPADSTRWGTEVADPVADVRAAIKMCEEWKPPPMALSRGFPRKALLNAIEQERNKARSDD